MTVTYTAEVATVRGLGCFLKLLARKRGMVSRAVRGAVGQGNLLRSRNQSLGSREEVSIGPSVGIPKIRNELEDEHRM
ncbi:hypothetical protein NQ315_017192 [Exocentrus adspersus]|uniref:Uncharacterized protein n=1 Tax=Exocentrus adspersus TaxID=1586481 RepID=A0AAV8VGW0_9CUCU|nr:hypothetical protein NQ315_017192 [Exocentrus adspersus]